MAFFELVTVEQLQNMIGVPISHAFVPADQKAVTFVFKTGMRRSFGFEKLEGWSLPDGDAKNLTIQSVELGASMASFKTDGQSIVFSFQSRLPGGGLVELPE